MKAKFVKFQLLKDGSVSITMTGGKKDMIEMCGLADKDVEINIPMEGNICDSIKMAKYESSLSAIKNIISACEHIENGPAYEFQEKNNFIGNDAVIRNGSPQFIPLFGVDAGDVITDKDIMIKSMKLSERAS